MTDNATCIECHQDTTIGRRKRCPACHWERTKQQKRTWRKTHNRRIYDHQYNTTHRQQKSQYMREYRARLKTALIAAIQTTTPTPQNIKTTKPTNTP